MSTMTQIPIKVKLLKMILNTSNKNMGKTDLHSSLTKQEKLVFYLTLNFIGGVLEHDEILSIDGEEFSGNNFNEALEKFESIMNTFL